MLTLSGENPWWWTCEVFPGTGCKGIDCLKTFYNWTGKPNTSCLDNTGASGSEIVCRCSCIRRDLNEILSVTSLDAQTRLTRLNYLAGLVERLDETKAILTTTIPPDGWQCWPESVLGLSTTLNPNEYANSILDIRLTALDGMLVDAKTSDSARTRALETYITILQTSYNPKLISTALKNIRDLIRNTPWDSDFVHLSSRRVQTTANEIDRIAASPKAYTSDVATLASYVSDEIESFITATAELPPGAKPPVTKPAPQGAKLKASGLVVFGVVTLGAVLGYGVYRVVKKR